jgi:hypothetical protein
MVEWEEAWGSDFGVGEGEIGGSESVSEIFIIKKETMCVFVLLTFLFASFPVFSSFLAFHNIYAKLKSTKLCVYTYVYLIYLHPHKLTHIHPNPQTKSSTSSWYCTKDSLCPVEIIVSPPGCVCMCVCVCVFPLSPVPPPSSTTTHTSPSP